MDIPDIVNDIYKYQEAIDALYEGHQFCLRHLFAAIVLPQRILPQRMNIVRNLRLVIPLTDSKVQDIFDYQMAKLT
jgi:hypothetical protein